MSKQRVPQAPVDTVELVDAINALRDEVKVLRESIDEFRTDFVHLLRNLPDNHSPPYQHLTTLTNVLETPAETIAATADDTPKEIPHASSSPVQGTRQPRSLFPDVNT